MTVIEPRRAAPAIRQEGIPAAARRRTGSPRQVLAACIVGAVVLGALAPPDLGSLTERWRGGVGVTVRAAVAIWERGEAALGLAEPHRALRRATQQLLATQWP